MSGRDTPRRATPHGTARHAPGPSPDGGQGGNEVQTLQTSSSSLLHMCERDRVKATTCSLLLEELEDRAVGGGGRDRRAAPPAPPAPPDAAHRGSSHSGILSRQQTPPPAGRDETKQRRFIMGLGRPAASSQRTRCRGGAAERPRMHTSCSEQSIAGVLTGAAVFANPRRR